MASYEYFQLTDSVVVADGETNRIANGKHVVMIAVSENKKIAIFAYFEEESKARAAASAACAGDFGAFGAVDTAAVATAGGVVVENPLTKAIVARIFKERKWEKFMTMGAAADAAGIVGKVGKFTGGVPVSEVDATSGAGMIIGMHDGDILIESAELANVIVKFTYAGVERQQLMPASYVMEKFVANGAVLKTVTIIALAELEANALPVHKKVKALPRSAAEADEGAIVFEEFVEVIDGVVDSRI